mgnify:FL=1
MMEEFMGFHRDADYNESDFEKALIDNLEKFIMELGRGFAFVERQQHIVTDTDDFYIDLVFYNYRMKRFVIFELKTHKLTHQDIGQLDMYVLINVMNNWVLVRRLILSKKKKISDTA